MEKLVKAFSEEEAEKILKEWALDNKYQINSVDIGPLWSYAETPFYSATAWLRKKGSAWGGTYRFHIHANGEVSVFRDAETDEDKEDEGC